MFIPFHTGKVIDILGSHYQPTSFVAAVFCSTLLNGQPRRSGHQHSLGQHTGQLGVILPTPVCDPSASSHSLKYFYTAVTAGIDFPEFTTVGLVDDEPFTYYDSVIRRETPKLSG
ncbi:hypothetical protein COCON_G00125550 [Conger conger]|uniref:MHC class I-like antigen recognition-like domain-containing protein n=1 Tax=Conger conger TaxID=82655 RepID=A0A9Q1HUY2_CONCO|nr:hypothetical protein COCON_G00125550 [Conger conger]